MGKRLTLAPGPGSIQGESGPQDAPRIKRTVPGPDLRPFKSRQVCVSESLTAKSGAKGAEVPAPENTPGPVST